MTDLNTAALIENERRVEARIARHERMHRELIDEIMDEVIDEIDAGQHDDELANSHLIDTTNAMAVARHVARDHERGPFKPEPDARAIWDLTMQIRDYAKDVAERRILRRMDDDL